MPDEEIPHDPEGSCENCGRDLADGEVLEGGERRQGFDLPEDVELRVVEHVARVRRCSGCGKEHAGAFPDSVKAPVSYGERIKALGVYLRVFQHIPYEGACLTLLDVWHADVSTGTLMAWVDQAAASLSEFDEQLRRLLISEGVLWLEQTGARIAGRLHWVHSASSQTLTRYSAHEKRGLDAMEHAGVLPDFQGVAIHDGWKPYSSFKGAQRALCGAHHLRELLAAQEAGATWASGMSALLLDRNDAVGKAKATGLKKRQPLCHMPRVPA